MQLTINLRAPSSPSGQAAPSSDWKLYLVQEYCNASLQDAMVTKLLHNKETMQPDMDLVLSILMDIARGLQYIHDKNIIHGDLTPGNVLLKHDSSSVIGVVGKITDFGLCSTIDPTRTHISNITNGTPYYVAPEVVECGMLTKTSDVYSFGVLMWELYRCMPPWVKTESGYQQNKRFRRFPPTSPHVYVALCARCLDKRSKKRPGCTQILAELEVMHAAYLMGYNGLQEPGAASSNPGTPGDTTAPVSPVAPAQLPMGTSELPSLPMPDVPERPLPVQKRGAMAAAPEGGDAPAAPAPPRSTTFVQHFASKSKV
ncbi:hypothetical protein FOA52_011824 [Chlamydomonas sp. UWO 241]|nr:hypothetical protein FOA52_011824 [Chlamydomonas sp. UWO 241]